MADQQINEMISAYAAGCMDKDNFVYFRDFIESGGNLPEHELGELQNVMALMPVLLDQKEPAPELKAKVAKKLIGLRDEIKARLKAEKKQTTEKPAPTLKEKTVPKHTTIVNKEISEPKNEPDDKPVTSMLEKKKLITKMETVAAFEKKLLETEKETSTDKKPELFSYQNIGIAVSAICLLFIVILYFIFSSGQSNLKSEINSLNSELSVLKQRTADAEFFINEQKNLVDFFAHQNITLVNLEGTSDNPDGSGKLLISFDKNEALLYTHKLPALNQGEVFVLWLVSGGRSYSVISFIPAESQKYIRINSLPYVIESEITMFRITSETSENREFPQGQTLMFGGIKK